MQPGGQVGQERVVYLLGDSRASLSSHARASATLLNGPTQSPLGPTTFQPSTHCSMRNSGGCCCSLTAMSPMARHVFRLAHALAIFPPLLPA